MRQAGRPERAGPTLSDGTPVASLIDVERREISLRLFSDPDVYRAEQQWLFGRCWNIVGHDSEIPHAGDYMVRRIANDAVIVSRDRDGDVNVVLNMCRHRGMEVCRSEFGSTTSFVCPYHGWRYGLDGSLIGVPYQKELYGAGLDKRALGLRRARVAMYAGIIFANWDPSAPSLEDFLGDFRWYLDLIFNRSKAGLECVGAPQRWVIRSNWKLPSEQFIGGDAYHFTSVHRSVVELRTQNGDQRSLSEALRGALHGMSISSRLGHGLRANRRRAGGSGVLAGPSALEATPDVDAREWFRELPPRGLPREMVGELFEKLTPGQITALLTYPPGPGGIFPNCGFNHANLRVHLPIGVDRFEMLNFVFVERDAPADYKAQIRKDMLFGFGTTGVAEQDDVEIWCSVQARASGYQGAQQTASYRSSLGHNPPEWWEGPEQVRCGYTKEDAAWLFWLRYRDYISGQPLEPLTPAQP
jgi:phenylpropionate dioxygenase-like ring-hydroxylating dioxygenase large terminal subunit